MLSFLKIFLGLFLIDCRLQFKLVEDISIDKTICHKMMKNQKIRENYITTTEK
jgi:hypothetical protein